MELWLPIDLSYRTMGIICSLLIVGALIAKKPLGRYQENQKADLEARKQSLKAQQMAAYKTEWERYKPIYDTFGMNEVWTSYEAGRCEEGKQILGLNRPTYRQTILNKNRKARKSNYLLLTFRKPSTTCWLWQTKGMTCAFVSERA